MISAPVLPLYLVFYTKTFMSYYELQGNRPLASA